MRSLLALPQPAPVLEWWEPEPKLWVALLDGDSIGTVEFQHGHFVTYNRGGSEITTSGSLPAAKAALAGRPIAAVPLSYLAIVFGIVAVSVASMTFVTMID